MSGAEWSPQVSCCPRSPPSSSSSCISPLLTECDGGFVVLPYFHTRPVESFRRWSAWAQGPAGSQVSSVLSSLLPFVHSLIHSHCRPLLSFLGATQVANISRKAWKRPVDMSVVAVCLLRDACVLPGTALSLRAHDLSSTCTSRRTPKESSWQTVELCCPKCGLQARGCGRLWETQAPCVSLRADKTPGDSCAPPVLSPSSSLRMPFITVTTVDRFQTEPVRSQIFAFVVP